MIGDDGNPPDIISPLAAGRSVKFNQVPACKPWIIMTNRRENRPRVPRPAAVAAAAAAKATDSDDAAGPGPGPAGPGGNPPGTVISRDDFTLIAKLPRGELPILLRLAGRVLYSDGSGPAARTGRRRRAGGPAAARSGHRGLPVAGAAQIMF